MSRLIDADALIISDEECVNTICRDCKMQINGCADFFDIIENATTIEPEPQWIPCSERLPERNQICIVTDETRRCAYEYGLHDETYDTETGWTYLGHKIIAWMPLPEPYKGGRGE